jgi:hypothetical protein
MGTKKKEREAVLRQNVRKNEKKNKERSKGEKIE